MNPAEILRRFARERREWLSYDETPETRWTIRGINLCIQHIKDIRRDQTYNERLRKPRIHRWLASDLYEALSRALRHLANGDRARAVVVLQNARDSVLKKAV